MKVYALWNIKKKAYYSTGHGGHMINIVNFYTKEEAQRFLVRIRGQEDYLIKGVSVGG